jgi:hypothetical protein
LNNIIVKSADFVDASASDFQLLNSSAAVDAGTAISSVLPLNDLAGNPRMFNDTIDLGCFENQGNNNGGNNGGGGGGDPVDSTTSIHQNTLQTYNVYPNPASDVLTIKGSATSDFDVTILSLSGQVLIEKQQTHQIQIGELS